MSSGRWASGPCSLPGKGLQWPAAEGERCLGAGLPRAERVRRGALAPAPRCTAVSVPPRIEGRVDGRGVSGPCPRWAQWKGGSSLCRARRVWEFPDLEKMGVAHLPRSQTGGWGHGAGRGSSVSKVTQRPPHSRELGFKNAGPLWAPAPPDPRGPQGPWIPVHKLP